jgi:integrase
MARTRTSGIRRLNRVKGTVFEVRFRDVDGHQRSRTFETMDQARAFQNAALTDVRDGAYVSPTAGVVPFLVVAEEWFAAQLQLKRRTQITYRSAIDHNLAPLHDKPVGRITYADVQAIVTAMTAAGRRPSTVRNVLMVCRLILDEAVRRKFIRTNPCHNVKPPRLRPRDNVFLTVEQVQALADQLDPPLDLLVLTAAGSGLRAGELNGLRVRDVELLRRRLNVRQTVTDLGSELIVDTPKSNAGRRTVPISPSLCDLLAAHIGNARLGMDDLVRRRRQAEAAQHVLPTSVQACRRPRGTAGRDAVPRSAAHVRVADDRCWREPEAAVRLDGPHDRLAHDGPLWPPLRRRVRSRHSRCSVRPPRFRI